MQFILMLLPWLELFTLIQLGVETSALTALGWVFLTLFLGLALLQRQGRSMFVKLNEMQGGRVIGPQLLVDEMAMGFAGLLLMVPGLITDCMALVVLVGPLRRRIARALGVGPQEPPVYPGEPGGHHTIEGDFRRVDDEDIR